MASEAHDRLFAVKVVVSDKIDCGAFEIARERGIPCFSISKNEKDGYISYDELLGKLAELGIELIVLAGFLKLIPSQLVTTYHQKIINIHPALLPSFGGKGMYGHFVHEAVFASGAKISGPTVHFIDEEYDKGYIIAQRCVDIADVESPEEIAERVLRAEHELLPEVVTAVAEGNVHVRNNRVYLTT